ncbi:MAG: serine/threonine protein kinase [Acidobacteria bacterium]|nr:serine/threonine protein kinase [Acidobacteriota bacterium]
MADADVPGRPDGPAFIGRYRIRARLAADAVGETFHGFDPLIERSVVIRVFHWPALNPDESQALTLRFFQEMQRIGVLMHPGIVPLFDAGDCSSGLFMASEYVDGSSLADVLAQEGPRDLERAMTMLGQIAEAIDYAHRQGVAHQDLKPTNVRLGADTMIRIGGFGVAQVVTAMRGSAGRPPSPYCAPEIAGGTPGDGRADVFAVGALAVALLGDDARPGRPDEPPVVSAGPLPHVLAARGASADGWASFGARALAAHPADRFATAEQLLRELAALAGFDYAPAAPAWDPFGPPIARPGDSGARESPAHPDGSSSDSSDSSDSSAATATHTPASAPGARPSGDDDLTVTKM